MPLEITRELNMGQLLAEFRAAGFAAHGLGTTGVGPDGKDYLITFTEDGTATDLPPQAAAVVAAHEPEPEPEVPASVQDQLAEVVSALKEAGALDDAAVAKLPAVLKDAVAARAEVKLDAQVEGLR